MGIDFGWDFGNIFSVQTEWDVLVRPVVIHKQILKFSYLKGSDGLPPELTIYNGIDSVKAIRVQSRKMVQEIAKALKCTRSISKVCLNPDSSYADITKSALSCIMTNELGYHPAHTDPQFALQCMINCMCVCRGFPAGQ